MDRFPEGNTFYIPIQIGLHTGMRAGEVCALTWDKIDFEEKLIVVDSTLIAKPKGIYEATTPKTRSSNRRIPVGSILMKILKHEMLRQKENKLLYGEHYTNNNFVCRKENGDHVTTGTFHYLSRVVNYELNIDFNFHAFRHSHATYLIEHGANMKDVQERLGHSKLATTMDTYSYVTKKMKTDTVSIVESFVIGSKK
jgi:integrase